MPLKEEQTLSKIKVGVVGVGSMGKNHVRSYAALKHKCKLVGIYDSSQKLKEEVAQGYGISSTSTVENLLNNVDAINIATPTTTHYEIAMKAIKRGKHLLIEKPITGTVEEAQALLTEAKKRGLIVQVGHIERFNPVIKALPDILQDKEIIALDVQRMGPYDPRIDDTDVIQDLMIHDIDVVNSIVPSSLQSISAFARRVKSREHMDYAVANMIMDNNIIATLTASRATNKKVRKMEITTLDSYVEVDYLQRKITVTQRAGMVPGSSDYQRENVLEETYDNEEEPLKLQLTHFINCIENGTRPIINGSDGLEALKLTKIIQNQVYRSTNEGLMNISNR